jgi:porin
MRISISFHLAPLQRKVGALFAIPGLAFFLCASAGSHGFAAESPPSPAAVTNQPPAFETIGEPITVPPLGISANPGAVNRMAGTGELADLLGLKKDTGVFVGGLWIGNSSYLISGGKEPGDWTGDSLLLLSLGLDLEKLLGWKGGKFGIEFLQFNGGDPNAAAGSVQGYNGLPGPDPSNRTELSQLWWRQELFDGKLIFRIGKMAPTVDFNNVLRPVPTQDEARGIPSVSGLIYTPIFKNPTLIGVMPGSYNTACGVTATVAPTDNIYVSYGLFDGNTVNGVQTGTTGPTFNGYYFNILEAGMAWEAGPNKLPGSFGVGGWYETGELRGPGVTQSGASGVYVFGSQRLWLRHPDQDNSGVSGYFQLGANGSKVLPFNQYVGAGLTAFGLVPRRARDSFGAGMAWSWLNPREFGRPSELMFQAYYQAHLVASTYIQPVISYIPTPGAGSDLSPAWAATLQLTVLF